MDLLALRALEGLDPLQGAELESLLAEELDLDADALDRAAAELELAHLEREGFVRPPQELLQKLRLLPAVLPAQTPRSATAARSAEVAAPAATAPATPLRALPRLEERAEEGAFALPWVAASGWITAAALLLAWLLFLAPRPAPTVEDLYEALRSNGNTLQVGWQDQKSGDLVWNNADQQGFMHLVGLERNDPSVSQYQLWIFDENQLEETPIDGGVFDVTDHEVIVPIAAKLRVMKPYLFAITVEKPGGVVRSTREKIVHLAHVPKTAPQTQ
ncbi:MAG: anti-sigma factor [Planctomycetes bacterium]|nr:anti-sigma factor [Planctomycetota bacterium]